MKFLPLIFINLKGFFRNWRSIFLLTIFPLVLIGMIFGSFNSSGISEIPVGVIGQIPGLDMSDLQEQYLNFLDITEFGHLDDCLPLLKRYDQYACVLVEGNKLIVYYDNTREPVIWEILERMKTSIDFLRRQKQRELTTSVLENFSEVYWQVDEFKNGLYRANSLIDTYMSRIDRSVKDLQVARNDLSSTLDSMDSDIAEAKAEKRQLKAEKDDAYSQSMSYLSSIESSINQLQNLSPMDIVYINTVRSKIHEVRSTLNSYDNNAERRFSLFDQKIYNYEQASYRGRSQLTKIDTGIVQSRNVKSDLSSYKNEVTQSRKDVEVLQEQIGAMNSLDANSIVDPVLLYNSPTYVPNLDNATLQRYANDEDSLLRGLNLISLQTIFPIILMLIVFFLALLISSFISLAEINSPAHERVMLVPRIFWHELFALYISSLIIIAIPLACVLVLGNYLFQIAIFANFGQVFWILLMVVSIFILAGTSLAYAIRKESITILISTFLLVFLIFFSGFILPVERMGDIPGIIASHLPGKLALSAFDQAVFYHQSMPVLWPYVKELWVWLLAMFFLTLIIKKVKKI